MQIKTLSLHLLALSMLLASYSVAQSSTDYSSIPNISSSQEEKVTAQQLNIDLFSSKNYSMELKVGEELIITVNNPDNLYHCGELEGVDLYQDPDLYHALCTSFYSDSWNPFNYTFSLQKENNL